MSLKFKKIILMFVLLIILIFFSYKLINKSEIEQRLDNNITKNRVINNLDIEIFDNNQKILKNNFYDLIKNNKKNLVHFWATWCSTCLADHERLLVLANQNPDLNIITVLFKDDINNIKELNIENTIFKNVNDSKGFVALEFGVFGVPESFILDNKGKVLDHVVGSLNKAVLK